MLKCILFHSHVCEIVQTGSVFSFSMPFKVMMIVRQFVFLGIYEFLGPSQSYFISRLAARANVIRTRVQNILVLANIYSIVL